ncbi:MAG: FprA family A-type flavoprotein [Bacteroidales bacterium]|nr:FprA family A-type flavoprotein [Bacteroidales bacterium]
MKNNQILEITPDVKWIGVLDPDLVTFDVVMETKYGTTYNSYFVDDEQKTIVETAKEKFWDIYEAKIRQLTDPAEILYIILNHTEPDHSGSVRNLLRIAPNATVVGSGVAIRNMHDLLGESFRHRIVKDGDSFSTGRKTFRFIGTPNLHWPDSMYTWLEPDNVLFTCDSFGAHYCHENMFDDLVGNWDDAFKYYFDVILKPFSRFMVKAIEKIRPLDIKAVCTGHGPILRSNWKKYVDWSEKLSQEAAIMQEANRVFIAYVSAYDNTGLLARKIAEGLAATGAIKVELHDIEAMPLSDIDDHLARCSGLIIGTPTINQNILAQIYSVFALISPIRDRGKLAGAFGSYGWSGDADKIIINNFEGLKLNYVGESLFIKFTPHNDALQKAFDYGLKFAEKVIANKMN